MAYRRRAFLIILAAIGGAFGIFRSWHSIKVFFSGAERGAEPETGRNPFRSREKSLVSAVGGRELKKMVGKAVSLLGGFELLEIEGKSVLVKPNVVGERSNPATTNPAVVKAVVELLYEAGAAKVYVGDMSALIRGGTEKNMEQTGIAQAARQGGRKPFFSRTMVGSKSRSTANISGKWTSPIGFSRWTR